MDPRALGALAARGYPNPRHVARQFERSWFAELDLVVGLARRHTQTLTSLGGASVAPGQVALLSSYLRGAPADIADPYYGDDADFDACLAAIEPCVAALAAHLVETEPWRRPTRCSLHHRRAHGRVRGRRPPGRAKEMTGA